MNKKFINCAIATVFGIALLIALSSTFTLIFDAITVNDVTILSSVGKTMEKTISYMRNTAVGIVCVNAAMLASFCFAYFSKNKKVFGCIAAGISLLSAVMCIAFIFDLRAFVLESTELSCYTAASAYFEKLITLTVVALLYFAYFLHVTIKDFLHKNANNGQSDVRETVEEEETENEKN